MKTEKSQWPIMGYDTMGTNTMMDALSAPRRQASTLANVGPNQLIAAAGYIKVQLNWEMEIMDSF